MKPPPTTWQTWAITMVKTLQWATRTKTKSKHLYETEAKQGSRTSRKQSSDCTIDFEAKNAIPSRPKLLQIIHFKNNCFGIINIVKITKQSLCKANSFACSLANRDKPVAATLQRKCSGRIICVLITKTHCKNHCSKGLFCNSLGQDGTCPSGKFKCIGQSEQSALGVWLPQAGLTSWRILTTSDEARLWHFGS